MENRFHKQGSHQDIISEIKFQKEDIANHRAYVFVFEK